MFNWRKLVLQTAAKLLNRRMFDNLKRLEAIEYESPEVLARLQNERLSNLLIHSYTNIPYYREILGKAEVIIEGIVHLENFYRVPVLTKDIIRREKEKLYSKDRDKRHFFMNSSGGSTGEPLRFIQDLNYKDWSLATSYYLNVMAGKSVGRPELKLWGSERDILKGRQKFMARVDSWLFNSVMLNCFLMSEENMRNYVLRWNQIRPTLVNAYTGSIYDFARFIKNQGVEIFRPAVIVCSAETLTNEVRNFIEEVFHCPALNHYGSREVGTMASECLEKGMHTFPLNNKVEILDNTLNPCPPGQTGSVYVTNLDNFAMPFIRYGIGDMAIPAKNTKCSCGRGAPLIETVIGRHIEVFKTKDGKVVPGEFFIHFVGVVYNKGIVKKFQVIQKSYDLNDLEFFTMPL
jgi:phenylacetate-CoA ligase